MKNKLLLLGALIFLGLNYSCKKEPEKIPDEINKAEGKAEAKTYNPYSVENMREAMSRLMMKDVQLLANNKQKYAHGTMVSTNSSAPLAINKNLTAKESVALVEKGIVATHYYIKFMPANDADYAKLKMDSNLIIYPFRLDAAVSPYSGSYRDPSVPAGVPTYQYASVRVGYVLPDVPYVKLADLFLPHETSPTKRVTIEGAANSSYSVSTNALEDESICFQLNQFIEPVECEEINYGGGSPSTGNGPGAPPGEWRPSGRLTMNDDVLGTIGVEGIKVRARRWFTTYTGISDANGYYYVDGTYTRPANYWLDFERYDFSVNDHSGGPREIGNVKQEGPWNLNFTGYDKFCATIFRAAFHYYYGDIQGLNRPPQNSFWATQVKIGAFNQAGENNTSLGRVFLFGELIKIYNNSYESSALLYATTIHELAHAVHWQMFVPDMNPGTILSGYSSVDDKICESWSRGVQWSLTKMVYPNYSGGTTSSIYTNVIVDMIDGEVPNYPILGWNYGYNGTQDQVEGYTILEIQMALYGQTTWSGWKNNIKNLYNNGTEQHIDALFTNWGN